MASTAGENFTWKGDFFSTAAMNFARRGMGVLRPGALAWPPELRAINFTSP